MGRTFLSDQITMCGAGVTRPREDLNIAAVFSPFLVGRPDLEQEIAAHAKHLAFERDLVHDRFAGEGARATPASKLHSMPPDVLILGAGVAGLSAALELARAGVNVEILERVT